MEILKFEQNKVFFIVNDKYIKPQALNKNHLLTILNDIYELEDSNSLTIPDTEQLECLRNPIEKEIVSHILEKIKEFQNNVIHVKEEINSQFPEINH